MLLALVPYSDSEMFAESSALIFVFFSVMPTEFRRDANLVKAISGPIFHLVLSSAKSYGDLTDKRPIRAARAGPRIQLTHSIPPFAAWRIDMYICFVRWSACPFGRTRPGINEKFSAGTWPRGQLVKTEFQEHAKHAAPGTARDSHFDATHRQPLTEDPVAKLERLGSQLLRVDGELR